MPSRKQLVSPITLLTENGDTGISCVTGHSIPPKCASWHLVNSKPEILSRSHIYQTILNSYVLWLDFDMLATKFRQVAVTVTISVL